MSGVNIRTGGRGLPLSFLFLSLLGAGLFRASPAAGGSPRDGGLGLCVGIGGYAHLERLETPVRDAEAVAACLLRTGGFRRVITLADGEAGGGAGDPRGLATRATLLETLRLIANNATRDDALVFFFSGHGLSHEGRFYLMPLDAEPREIIDPGAGIPVDEITAIMRGSRAAGKLLLIDANSDAELFPGVDGPVDAGAGDFAVIVSCGEGQRSLTDPGRGLGLFALGLEAALSGRADADSNGELTLDELRLFLEGYMADYCLENLAGAGQAPRTTAESPRLTLMYGPNFGKMAAAAEAPETAAGGGGAEEEGTAASGAEAAAEAATAAENAADRSDADALERRLAAAAALRAEGKREAAFAAFMELTEYGLPEAEFQVGESYYFGAGAGQDRGKAEEWFIRAGDLGHAKAQEMLAGMYWWGTGVPQDRQKAAKWSLLQGRIPDDAKPRIGKRPHAPAPAPAPDAAKAGDGAEKTAEPAVVQLPEPPRAVPAPQYRQQQYQQDDPNSFGRRTRRFFFGY